VVRRERRRAALATAGVLTVALAAVVLAVALGSGSSPPGARHTSTVSSSSPASTTATRPPPASTTATLPPPTATLPPPARTPRPAAPAPSAEEFGASVNLLFNGQGPPAATIAAQLRGLRATGATVARSDAFWEASEPTAPVRGHHAFVWTFDDQIATALATAGLRWLPVLDYTAPWAQSIAGQDHSPPRSAADYAAYAEAFAARYGPRGTFWALHPELPRLPVQTFEIWNEPDNGTFWTPRPDAAAYAGLYSAARDAVDAVDPSARVIIGGLTKLSSFLPAMLAAMPSLHGHIDGVGMHPYGTPSVALARVRTDRAALRRLGLGEVPLYATEFGWTTRNPRALDYVPAAQRPRLILRTLAELDHGRCGVAAAVIYTWYSPERDASDSQQWYGISSLSGAGTADTAALTVGLHGAGNAGTPGRC
jgi:hypothetical protein